MSIDIGTLYTRVEADTKGLQKSEAEVSKFASRAAGIIATAFAGVSIGALIKKTTLDAARYETLGASMGVVGKNAGYSREELKKFQGELQKSGISMLKSREAIIRMAQAQIDLSQSADLARIAQNAAVIGNMDSSQAFQKLVYGIQSAQTEVLRNIGLNVDFEQSYKDLAAQLGKSVTELTNYEKTQARLQGTMKEGQKIMGTYEAAMETAGKKLGSLTRHFSNASVKIGEVFLPAFGVAIDEVTERIKDFNDGLDSADIEFWGEVLGDATNVVVNFGDHLDDIVDRKLPAFNNLLGETGLSIRDFTPGKFGGSFIGTLERATNLSNKLAASLREKISFDGFEDSLKDMYHKVKTSLMSPEQLEDYALSQVAGDDYVDSWLRFADTAKEAHEDVKESAQDLEAARKESLKKIEEEWEKHRDAIIRINEEIEQNQLSGEQLVRSMERSGMSDLAAWKDMKKEAQEYESAAKKAAEAGDFEKALEYIDIAQDRFQDLNKEVKKGDVVQISSKKALQEALSGVKRMIDLRDQALKSQKQIEVDAANALAEKANKQGGALKLFEDIETKSKDLTVTSFPALKKGFGDVWEEGGRIAGDNLDAIDAQLDKIHRNIDAIGDSWGKMEGVNLNSRHYIAKRHGGPIFASNGRYFPGYGGGDKIPIMGEAGEFMLRKEAVKGAGLSVADAFNRKDWPEVVARLSRKMSSGGSVGFSSLSNLGGLSNVLSGSQGSSPRNYYIPGDPNPIRMRSDDINAQRMLDALERAYRRRS